MEIYGKHKGLSLVFVNISFLETFLCFRSTKDIFHSPKKHHNDTFFAKNVCAAGKFLKMKQTRKVVVGNFLKGLTKNADISRLGMLLSLVISKF